MKTHKVLMSVGSTGGIRALAAVLALSAVPAGAQSDVGVAADVGESAEIVVTGSRLSTFGYSAPTPVTVVGREDLQREGVTNVADLLNTLPAFRPQSTPATTAIFIANAGANLVDLRGLGAQRTLVLVDGRRFVASTVAGGGFAPSGTVDLNMIPSALIKRTEVVTGGASAAYGSDAVAGVVNLLLDTSFTGVRGSVQNGISEAGDATETFVTLSAGSPFSGGAGHFIIGGEYAQNDGTGDCYTRAWCAESYSIASNPSPQVNGEARRVIVKNSTQAMASFGGLITSGPLRGMEFRDDGTTFQHDYGTYFATPPAYSNGGITQGGGGADGLNGNYINFPLSAPTKRYSLLAHVDYHFSTLRAFVEGSYGKVIARTIGSQGRNNGNIVIARDNAFLPATVGERMDSAGISSFNFGRTQTDIGPQRGRVERETYRIAAGLSGALAANWSWDAYYQFGRTNYGMTGEHTQISGNGSTFSSNFMNAVDAVDEGEFRTGAKNGNIVCRGTLTNPDHPYLQGCQPLNLFGQNNFSQEAVGYAYGNSWQETQLTQHVAAANIQGELAQLPGGGLGVAFGAEYRTEGANGTNDPLSAALRLFTSPGAAISGPTIRIKEVYGEFAAPLLVDVPLAKALSLNGAVRLTDYSTSGSVTSWKIGGVWEVTDLLRLRLTRSRDIRAPNFFELNSPVTTSFQALIDPRTGANELRTVRLSGNPNLRPEIANTFTVGAVLSPASRFRLSVDYYDIKLDGAIDKLGGQVVLNRCESGNTALCEYVNRDPAELLLSVSNPDLNLNSLKVRGLDVETSYSVPVGTGQISLRALGTYLLDMITIDSTGVMVNRAGMNGAPVSQPSGLPTFAGNAYLTWSNQTFAGTVQIRYISKGVFDATAIGPHQSGYSPLGAGSISDNEIAAETYVSLNMQYNLLDRNGRKVQLFGVINNLFDNDPPNDVPGSFGPTNNVLYDVIGRSYKLGVRFNF
ncbi:MAG TPA: TonB-dependent receptor [Sphingobium sp.]|nr:TonB-dependent receptor [Sphingobium sp.]